MLPTTASWKTTVTGLLAALGALLAGMPDVGQAGWVKLVGLTVTILGTVGMGLFARDHTAEGGGLDADTTAQVKAEIANLTATLAAMKASQTATKTTNSVVDGSGT